MYNKMIVRKNNNKNFIYKFFTVFIVILLACISYNIVPKQELDLYRYYLNVDSYSNLNFNEFVNQILLVKSEPLFNVICFILGKIQQKTMLPALFLIITYFSNLYIYFDYIKDKDIKTYIKVLSVIYILLYNLLYTMLGFRSVVAMAIISLILYLQKVKKIKKLSVLYIIPIFIHTLSFFIVSIIFMINIYTKLKYKNKKYIIALGIILAITAYLCLHHINIPLKQNYNFIEYIIIKMQVYSFGTILFSFDNIMRLLFCLFCNGVLLKYNKLITSENNEYLKTIFVINIIYFISFFAFSGENIYNRIYDFVAINNIIILNKLSINNHMKKYEKYILMSISILYIINCIKNQYLGFMYNLK